MAWWNKIKKSVLAVIVLLALSVPAEAVVYTWSSHNLNFEVPEGGFVTYSSTTRFEVQWDDMVMTIQIYSKDKCTDQRIKENLQSKALGYNMYDKQLGTMKVKGFKTFCIEGTMPDGSRAIIADLISSKRNLIAEVTINYLFGNRDIVDDIITSFSHGKASDAKEKKHKQKIQSKQDADKGGKKPKQPVTPEQPKKTDGPVFEI